MTMSRTKRVQRVERELFETLSQFLLHEIGEPLPCHAAITAVEVTPDLRNARIFFRLVGHDASVKEAKAILNDERPHFQKHVAKNIKLKFCPVLRFEYGVAPHLDEIDTLLENLKRPRGFGD